MNSAAIRLAFFRGVIGCAVLLPGARAFRTERPDRRTAALLLFTGAAIGVNWMLLFEAYRYTTVQVATLCYYMEPTFVILLSWLLGRERMTGTKAVCALMRPRSTKKAVNTKPRNATVSMAAMIRVSFLLATCVFSFPFISLSVSP